MAAVGAGAAAVREMDESGRLTAILPELEAGRGFVQPVMHYFDVLNHNLETVAAFDRSIGHGEEGIELRAVLDWMDFDASLGREIEGWPLVTLTRLACLVHDVAKPATATIVDERLRFPRHGPRGAEMMRARLPEVGFGPESTEFVAKMVRYHLRPAELVKAWPVTDKAVRKFVADVDGHALPLMLVNISDGMAVRGPTYTRESFRRHCTFVNYVVARALAANDEGEHPLLTGDDLIENLNLESGRLLGAVLTSVRRAQLDGSISNRDEALVLARSVLVNLRANDS